MSSAQIHLIFFSLRQPSSRVQSLQSFLSPDERKRAEKLTTLDMKRRFIVGRGMMRKMLGKRLGQDPKKLKFQKGSHGKPSLPKIHFNLSHSANHALLAIADRPIGVDIEKVRALPNLLTIIERFVSSSAVKEIKDMPRATQRRCLLALWTRHEARLKRKGVGVFNRPRIADDSTTMTWALKVKKEIFIASVSI